MFSLVFPQLLAFSTSKTQLLLIGSSQHRPGQPATCHVRWSQVSVPRESMVSAQIRAIFFANSMVCVAVWISCVPVR